VSSTATTSRSPGRSRVQAALGWASQPAGWVLAGLVLVVALVIGSIHPAPPTRAARIAHLEDVLKCPSCVDLSIRQSGAAAALDLRAEVVRLVDAGKTNAQIERIAVAQYGSAELLVPPTSGLGTLEWLLPVIGLAGGGAAVGIFLVRRRRRGIEPPPGPSAEDEALVRQALAQKVGS